jgi:PadR family transcriptional regulator, regulatory protein PadR
MYEGEALFPRSDLQRGAAEMVVLGVLRDRPMYGYEIIRELQSRGEGYFAMEEGLLYPTLHRLEREGLVRSDWRTAESGRRRRYYAVTGTGLAALSIAVAEWRTYVRRLLGMVDPLGGTSDARS